MFAPRCSTPCWPDARGALLLRIEDTDRERSRPEYVAALLEDLRWLGLDWQEGPEIGGPHPPYAQSERTAIYADYYQRLEAADQAYPCFCTPAELALSRKTQLAAGRPPRYAGTCARLGAAQQQAWRERGVQPTLRFRTPPDKRCSSPIWREVRNSSPAMTLAISSFAGLMAGRNSFCQRGRRCADGDYSPVAR